jgi:hypothetical protein
MNIEPTRSTAAGQVPPRLRPMHCPPLMINEQDDAGRVAASSIASTVAQASRLPSRSRIRCRGRSRAPRPAWAFRPLARTVATRGNGCQVNRKSCDCKEPRVTFRIVAIRFVPSDRTTLAPDCAICPFARA